MHNNGFHCASLAYLFDHIHPILNFFFMKLLSRVKEVDGKERVCISQPVTPLNPTVSSSP